MRGIEIRRGSSGDLTTQPAPGDALRIEERAGIPVLVFANGSCRPATTAEVTLAAQADDLSARLAEAERENARLRAALDA